VRSHIKKKNMIPNKEYTITYHVPNFKINKVTKKPEFSQYQPTKTKARYICNLSDKSYTFEVNYKDLFPLEYLFDKKKTVHIEREFIEF
jgi:hypothetical protein